MMSYSIYNYSMFINCNYSEYECLHYRENITKLINIIYNFISVKCGWKLDILKLSATLHFV